MQSANGDDVVIPEERPDAVYRSPNSLAAIGALIFGVLLLLLEIHLVRQVLSGDLRGKMAMIPWLLPIGIGFLLYWGLANLLHPIVVAVYPHGFLYARGRHIDFCPWERVQAFWCYQYAPPETMHRHKYWVTRDDGVVFAFKGSRLNDVRDLAGRIMENVHDRLLAPALEAYNAGQPVSFGPITIDPEGLEYRGQYLRWEQMTGIRADAESDFVIEKLGKTYAWCELSTSRIPNFPVLLVLLNEHVWVADGWGELLL